MTEFEKLVIGALNVLLAHAAGQSKDNEAIAYYQSWLERVRKLEQLTTP